jgi:hypothetical protein
VFYKNISQTHEHKKVPIIVSELKNAINDFGITQVIILGAQNREDVYQLIVQSLCFNIKVICIEYRKEEITTWLQHTTIWKSFFNKYNLSFINKDADDLITSSWLSEVCENNKTLVYDNLSGSPKRLNFWDIIINTSGVCKLIAYAVVHGGSTNKAKVLFVDKHINCYSISKTSNILSISNQKSGIKEFITYHVNKKIRKRSVIQHEKSKGIWCPNCGTGQGYISARTTKIPEFRCICGYTFDRCQAQKFPSTKKQLELRKSMGISAKHGLQNKLKRNTLCHF